MHGMHKRSLRGKMGNGHRLMTHKRPIKSIFRRIGKSIGIALHVAYNPLVPQRFTGNEIIEWE